MIDPNEPRRLSFAAQFGVFVFCFSLLCVNLGGVVLSRHEVLAAQPAREMLATGDWIIPRFAGEPRLVKPPTTGWVLAAAMWVAGSRAEWIVRLPGVIAGALCCVLIARVTARILGARAGLYAGLLQGTSYFILMQARLAEADIFLCLAVTAAMGVLMQFCLEGGEKPTLRSITLTSLAFYVFVAVAFLFKGPAGPAFVLLASIAYAAWARDRRVVRLLIDPAGLVVFIAIAGAWPFLAYRAYPPIVDVWFRETGGRFAGEMGDPEPWWFYVVNVPFILLPWFPLAVIGTIAGVRRGWHHKPAGRLLICWLSAGLVLLSISAWKHKHYALPLVPACLPATAVGLMLWLRFAREQAKPRPLLSAAIVLIVAVGIALAGRRAVPSGSGVMILVASAFAVGGLFVVVADWLRKDYLRAVGIFATAWLTIAAVEWKVLPRFEGYRPFADFARELNQTLPRDATVWLVEMGEHHIAYYLDRPLRRMDDSSANSGRLFFEINWNDRLLVPTQDVERLRNRAPGPIVVERDMPPMPRNKYERLSLLRFTRPTSP